MTISILLSNDNTYILSTIVGEQTMGMVRQSFAEIATLVSATGVTRIPG